MSRYNSTDQFDAISLLVKWVEQGQAPDQIIASARGAGNAGGQNDDLPLKRSLRVHCSIATGYCQKLMGFYSKALDFFSHQRKETAMPESPAKELIK